MSDTRHRGAGEADRIPEQPQHDPREILIAQFRRQVRIDQAKIANLEVALQTARRIGAAVGIIMAEHKMTEDEAFELLQQVSSHREQKLRDIAQEVVQTGTLIQT